MVNVNGVLEIRAGLVFFKQVSITKAEISGPKYKSLL